MKNILSRILILVPLFCSIFGLNFLFGLLLVYVVEYFLMIYHPFMSFCVISIFSLLLNHITLVVYYVLQKDALNGEGIALMGVSYKSWRGRVLSNFEIIYFILIAFLSWNLSYFYIKLRYDKKGVALNGLNYFIKLVLMTFLNNVAWATLLGYLFKKYLLFE